MELRGSKVLISIPVGYSNIAVLNQMLIEDNIFT